MDALIEKSLLYLKIAYIYKYYFSMLLLNIFYCNKFYNLFMYVKDV